ncbi:MAG: hypothetical protein QME68_03370 [Elusimicrobiota bacterium]|nr:hypothetical protein [Elusimicrobiota bacterium]
MKAVIDRIEVGINNKKIAVVKIFPSVEIVHIPVDEFGFEVYEGMWLEVEFKHDSKSEEKIRKTVTKIQTEIASC